MKKFGEFIKETPTNSSGDGGFSGSASSPVAGYDKTLWSYMVTNAYQSPMDLSYRWSNIFPVKKLSLEDIDDMVDASKEFVNYMNRSTLTKKLLNSFKNLRKQRNVRRVNIIVLLIKNVRRFQLDIGWDMVGV